MNPATLAALADLISRGGLLVVGLIFIYLLLTDKLVPKKRLDDEQLWRRELADRFQMLLDLLRVRLSKPTRRDDDDEAQ